MNETTNVERTFLWQLKRTPKSGLEIVSLLEQYSLEENFGLTGQLEQFKDGDDNCDQQDGRVFGRNVP